MVIALLDYYFVGSVLDFFAIIKLNMLIKIMFFLQQLYHN